MAVTLTWSVTSGGAAISSALDHGNASNGTNTTAQTIYVRHDGANAITNASLYFRQMSGTYTGSLSAAADYTEILAWGNETVAAEWGGVCVSWNSSTWASETSKSASTHFVLSTGYGDGEDNAVTIPTSTGASSAGVIDSGSSITFQVRFKVPTNEDTVGIRQIESVIAYTYTS